MAFQVVDDLVNSKMFSGALDMPTKTSTITSNADSVNISKVRNWDISMEEKKFSQIYAGTIFFSCPKPL